jgi:hypothetical protein
MGLKRMLCSNWYIRIVLISWIISAVSIYILFKNMELIVHGQLYYYGLVLSPDWADPYRIYTWLIYVSLGVPVVLSGPALVSSFLKIKKTPEKEVRTTQPSLSQGIGKMESKKIVKNVPKKVENGNGNGNGCGISCPRCKKVFGKALVMLDFHGGKNQLVSVCPYCNYILGNPRDEKATSTSLADSDKKIIH